LRRHDTELGEMLAKGQTAGGPTIARQVTPPPLTDIDLTKIDDRGGVVTAPAYGDRKAELTLAAKYQRAAVGLLRGGRVPEGAILVSDVSTGKVLVWASYVEEGAFHDVASEATAPSASVFKLVTGAALVEDAGLSPTTKQCYSGGEHSIRAIDMVEDKKRDRWCATLAQAMGRSLNTVFARLAAQHLDRNKLGAMAAKLGWGQDVPFDVKVATSTLTLPEDELEFARTAAGFWNSTMSPFQALNLVTTIAAGGEMVRLHVVSSVKDDAGEIYHGPTARQVVKRAIDEPTASALTAMMEATVDGGTSYRAFHDKRGRAYLPDIRVAGKTGTLTKPAADGPFYTWFVGFAPSRKPEVAIAVLVANGAKWRVKASNVGADVLRVYFADKGAAGVTDPFERANTTAQR
jgi:cell division protein FtsI/penicillin-binding protein 2